jgi:hypothetical protein
MKDGYGHGYGGGDGYWDAVQQCGAEANIELSGMSEMSGMRPHMHPHPFANHSMFEYHRQCGAFYGIVLRLLRTTQALARVHGLPEVRRRPRSPRRE